MKGWSVILALSFLSVISAKTPDKGYIVCNLKYYYQAIDSFAWAANGYGPEENIYEYRYYYYNLKDIALDPRNNRAFLLDSDKSSILQADGFDLGLYSYTTSEIQYGMSNNPNTKLAYDWLADNLYWTDSNFNWIVMMPVGKDRPMEHRVIVHDGLLVPTALGVDPNEKYLFFAEQGGKTIYIARTDLDGSNKKHIRTFGYIIVDIAPDVFQKRIYWVDNEENAVYYSDYEGNTDVLFRKPEFFGYMGSVAVTQQVVCVTEAISGYLECINKDTGSETWTYSYYYDSPWIGRIWNNDDQLMEPHGCQNLRCEYICVNKKDGPMCLCPDGYDLTVNNTCEKKHDLFARGFLIAKSTSICMLGKGVLVDNQDTYNDDVCFFTWNSTINHLAVNARNLTIFFTDRKGIYKHDVIENTTTPVTTAMDISGLAYDWNEQYLYWSEKTTGNINRIVTAIGATPGLGNVFSGLSSPSDLRINPHNFTLYWFTTSEARYNVMGGTYDGSSSWVIKYDLENPYGLYFDVATFRVFWIEKDYIYSIKSDGTDQKQLSRAFLDTMLIVYKDYVITTSTTGDIKVSYAYTTTASPRTIAPDSTGNISAIEELDDTTQRLEIGVCEIDNGGCEQMCVPEANKQRVCKCYHGFVTNATNPAGCTSYPMTTDFVLVVDFSHKQILEIDVNNASHVVAIDNKNAKDPLAAIYIPETQKIVWTDYVTNDIMESDLNGDNEVFIKGPGQYNIYSLTSDPSTGNIFYAASPSFIADPFIGVLNPVTRKHREIITKDLSDIYSLLVYPLEGKLFYIDPGYYGFGNGVISVASMDGSGTDYLISTDLKVPNSIAIQYPSGSKPGRLYWSDLIDERIYSIPIDKSEGKTEFFHDQASLLAHIAIAGNYLYYTATDKQFITRVDMETRRIDYDWMNRNEDLGRLESIDIYTNVARDVHPHCSVINGMCSTFCLPTSKSQYVCACEDGIDLSSDGRTCSNVKKCDDVVLNGQLPNNCTGYINVTCDYTCNDGFQRVDDTLLVCSDSGLVATWNKNLQTICVPIPPPTTSTSTPTPITVPQATFSPLTSSKTEGIATETFVVVILALIVLFLLVLFGVVFYLRRQKSENMFGHAKFVNSGNVSMDASAPENNYSTLEPPGSMHARGDGMENPLYEAKNGPPKQPTYDNTMSQQDQINLDMPIKF